MADDAARYLVRQFDTAWKLTSYHLDGLSTEALLWRPARRGLHVRRGPDGTWLVDWPEHEGYAIGPPSMAWLTWHMGFWWSMVLDHSFGAGTLARADVHWPGSADGVREWLGELQDRWRMELDRITDQDLRSEKRTRWPFEGRPFGDVVAWVNLELTKNASELGYARFLHAVRTVDPPGDPNDAVDLRDPGDPDELGELRDSDDPVDSRDPDNPEDIAIGLP